MLKQGFEGILVVKGAEYAAVCRGIKNSKMKGIEIISIPMGVKALTTYLEQAELKQQKVLLLGLGGSINPEYSLGNVVVYDRCYYQVDSLQCDRSISVSLQAKLKANWGKGLTCDRLIHSVQAKQEKRASTGADIVDMESFVVLQKFPQVAIVRVISDNYDQSLPDLNLALDSQGNLDKIALAIAMSQQPLAALRLIHSSLKSLKILEKVTCKLFLE
ncbi:hypothetical protein [Gloeocapsa sp. PCC 73106]|uniref:hypothetical protein n=1 Tax=Gloeocapsa sp. PCC 73106 TaxID=102232 RepID=UPI0002ACF9B2|nr:hypothetical protein [Gloeocapsa sp. PCC 73106]ELR96841.1 nucleoside phosphorylase [Gloeocapsa sp. PCC 73106]